MNSVKVDVTVNITDTREQDYEIEVSPVAVATLLNQLQLPEKWQSVMICLSNPNREPSDG